ncbi:head GIN domain-containing protein [Robiginitomaculum antarcticum]|uniref:head GIN domain-containing protein n=1 Tax=Robiginitomaculum antarcticum TaxID=437507 RepID=UPI0003757565|nr:head GIN domain-containing protein [Robiginitomaculum antarcticum]
MTQYYLNAAAIALALGFASTAAAHDSEEKITQSHDLSGFSKIDVTGVYKITLTQGDTFVVTTSGEADEVERMEVNVKGDTLILGRKDKKWPRKNAENHGIETLITMPQLTSLDVIGVAEVKGENLTLGDVDMDIAGVASVEISGTCDDITASVNGVGELDLRDLECKTGDLSVNGAGSVSAYTSESVKARVNGVGEVTVYGKPAKVDKRKGWLGSVTIK